MRPVNLIPPEERRGDRAALRAGKLSYLLVGGLVAVLAVVGAVVLTGNQVNDRKSELAELEQREAAATAQAEALRPYADFASLTAARTATVTSLAQSRFDWERIFRELALVLPDDVWLTSLNGTVAGGAGGEGDSSDNSIAGPSLAMSGCGKGHDAVARLLQALRDIDGVTRVGLSSSGVTGESGEAAAGGAGGTASSGGDCSARGMLASFEVTVAFDAVPEPSSPTAPAVPPATDPTVPTETQEARNAVAKQSERVEDAANIVPGVAR